LRLGLWVEASGRGGQCTGQLECEQPGEGEGSGGRESAVSLANANACLCHKLWGLHCMLGSRVEPHCPPCTPFPSLPTPLHPHWPPSSLPSRTPFLSPPLPPYTPAPSSAAIMRRRVLRTPESSSSSSPPQCGCCCCCC